MVSYRKISITALLLLLVLTGCTGKAPAEPQQPSQPGSTNTTQPVQQPDPNQEATPTQMDENAIVKLTANGIKAYWHIMTGGNPPEDGSPVQTFLVNGKDYRYLGTDLDTMEKLTGSLAPFFSKESIDAFIKKAGIIEQEGRMAQPNADGGSILQWDKATAELAKEADGMKQYEMKVPVGDGTNVQFEPVMVEVRDVKGVGWRIHTPPDELR